jgi:thioredoxin-like negative regulator of GroEL
MIERVALLVSLSLAAVAAYYALRAVHVRRMQPAAPAETVLPSLLYFRADSCAVCPAQGRAIDQLTGQWAGRVSIRHIDAEREPEVAAGYRVFTLPTTILLDGDGRVRQVNYGLADERKLDRQLRHLLGGPSPIVTDADTNAIQSV